jgi:uncharacterized protein YbcI
MDRPASMNEAAAERRGHRPRQEQQGHSVMRTKGQTEAEISEALIKFEREYMGRGPEEAKTYIVDDLVIVRLIGILTPAEKNLAKIEDVRHGRNLIKQVRNELLEKARPQLDAIIKDITGQNVTSLHTDISTSTGERVIIFALQHPPELENAGA